MVSKAAAKEVIRTLEAGRFYAECPCCRDSLLLKDAGLFCLNGVTPKARELYRRRLEETHQRRKDISRSKESIPRVSQVTAQAVHIGFILEREAPVLDSFQFDHKDCRALFDPIDYVVSEGLRAKGRVESITFVDIKTGAAQLTARQKQIRLVIDEGHVGWETYRLKGASMSPPLPTYFALQRSILGICPRCGGFSA